MSKYYPPSWGGGKGKGKRAAPGAWPQATQPKVIYVSKSQGSSTVKPSPQVVRPPARAGARQVFPDQPPAKRVRSGNDRSYGSSQASNTWAQSWKSSESWGAYPQQPHVVAAVKPPKVVPGLQHSSPRVVPAMRDMRSSSASSSLHSQRRASAWSSQQPRVLPPRKPGSNTPRVLPPRKPGSTGPVGANLVLSSQASLRARLSRPTFTKQKLSLRQGRGHFPRQPAIPPPPGARRVASSQGAGPRIVPALKPRLPRVIPAKRVMAYQGKKQASRGSSAVLGEGLSIKKALKARMSQRQWQGGQSMGARRVKQASSGTSHTPRVIKALRKSRSERTEDDENEPAEGHEEEQEVGAGSWQAFEESDPLYAILGSLAEDPVVSDGVLNDERFNSVITSLLDGHIDIEEQDWNKVWSAFAIPASVQKDALQRLLSFGLAPDAHQQVPEIVADLIKARRVKFEAAAESMESLAEGLDDDGRGAFAMTLFRLFPKTASAEWGWSRNGWSWAQWWKLVERILSAMGDTEAYFQTLVEIMRLFELECSEPLREQQLWAQGGRIEIVKNALLSIGSIDEETLSGYGLGL